MLRMAGAVATLALVAAVSGCATNRSELSLRPPDALPVTAGTPVSGAKPIAIRSVRDVRVFEEKPRDPSVPSLGFEGSAQASADVKARAVGRKRNTYGMALGDVLLEPGDTVERRVRAELVKGLEDAGYRVVSGPEAASAPAIDVRILQFWSWITPGFWTITLATNITTELSVAGSSSPITVDVKSADAVLAATDGVWVESLQKALQRYRTEVAGRKALLP
jgi:hypothetical protein